MITVLESEVIDLGQKQHHFAGKEVPSRATKSAIISGASK